ncbi:MAG: hypothetical protein ACRD0G_11455 [Acidimicrobiales bacterium]
MAGKFQIRSRKWDLGVLIGSVAVLAVGFGGLFLLHASGDAPGSPTLLFVLLLGILTFAFFAGPGLVYVLRKRVKAIKNALPGGTMTWIRSHLYLPVLALVAALVHASVVPFRATLSSGKVLFLLGVLVSVAGLARHHLIGIQKAAININVAVGKLTTGQPRAFRRLVADYVDHKRGREEVDAAMAGFGPGLQERWAKITQISDEVEKHFPRDGGQRWHIRQYKVWRALHPPLTIALFLVLGYHVWDVFGGNRAVAGDEQAFATASECADCHSAIYDEWAQSTMAHAQVSTIYEAQLPITLAENRRIIEEFGDEISERLGRDQEDLVEESAAVCINCHAPIGASFVDDPFTLLPFDDDNTASLGERGTAVSGGNEAVNADGIGCVACHSQSEPPAELQGAAALLGDTIGEAGADYGTMFGPLFDDPGPLPVRIHDIETPDSGLWADPIQTSQLCGACHNVALDMDGDGLTAVDGADPEPIADILDDPSDADGDFILDENELDDGVPNEDGIENDDADGRIDDLVLQTTYDEWQDYVAFFDADGGFEDRYAEAEFSNELRSPLGCTNCHMPIEGDGTDAVVDYAPGLLSTPDRPHLEHTFVGVDYDLDLDVYRDHGLSDDEIVRVLAERDALVQSAVTMQVETLDGIDDPVLGRLLPVDVTVRNNLLAHSFPTGFAFARQFWIEISAETEDGEPVCLSPGFFDVDTGDALINEPCGSGFADAEGTEPVEGADELRQCDVRAFLESPDIGVDPQEVIDNGGVVPGTDVVIPNADVLFAPGAAFGPDECDPWLANFQKILTDADPDGDGLRQEVPYQPLLPDAVQIRGQLATGASMFELQPVRLRNDEDASTATTQYTFDVPDGVDDDEVVVTARMRFRHLPPYFVDDLDARQDDLGDDVPEGARIDADDLLETMLVSEVVTATTDDDAEQLECEGPQNEATSILECIDDDDLDDARERLGLGGRQRSLAGRDTDGERNALGAGVPATTGGVAALGLLLRRRRRR